MKLIFCFFVISFSFTNSQASTLNTLNEVVFGVDFSDGPWIPTYPCLTFMSSVFCDKSITLENNCAKTLKITSDSLSCIALNNERVVFGKIIKESFFEDETSPGTGAYHVNYSSRVHLEKIKNQKNTTEYKVIVD